MRLIDADALLSNRMKSKYYHLKNGDVAIPLIDIEHAPTIGGWISVRDRLPVRPPDVCGLHVYRQWYLVALESGAVLTLSYEFDEDRWQGVGSPVTHWMPLPQAPEEVTRDENC